MKSRYQNWFWLAIGIVALLLGLIILAGYSLLGKNGISFSLPVLQPPATPTASILPVQVEVILPEAIATNEEFNLTIRMVNPNPQPVQLLEVILPRNAWDNLQIIATDAPHPQNHITEVGIGYPLNEELAPGGERLIKFKLRADKMLAVSGNLEVYSDLGKTVSPLNIMIIPPETTGAFLTP